MKTYLRKHVRGASPFQERPFYQRRGAKVLPLEWSWSQPWTGATSSFQIVRMTAADLFGIDEVDPRLLVLTKCYPRGRSTHPNHQDAGHCSCLDRDQHPWRIEGKLPDLTHPPNYCSAKGLGQPFNSHFFYTPTFVYGTCWFCLYEQLLGDPLIS